MAALPPYALAWVCDFEFVDDVLRDSMDKLLGNEGLVLVKVVAGLEWFEFVDLTSAARGTTVCGEFVRAMTGFEDVVVSTEDAELVA